MEKKIFKVGQRFDVRAITNHDCIFKFEIVGRTEKTVSVKDLVCNKVYRRKIQEWEKGVESCSPYGNYSMAPTIRARG